MSADNPIIVGFGALCCLITTGVALFFAMYFGTLFSIPGVIVLLIIGFMVIISLYHLLSESQQKATTYHNAKKHLKKQLEEKEQQLEWERKERQLEWERKERQWNELEQKKRQEQEGRWCLVM